MSKQSFPLISLIIPCRNEAAFIRECIDSVLNADYPADRVEILAVDGMSTDETSSILSSYVGNAKGLSFKILQNPLKIFPAAVNVGVREASGEYVFILGAHAVYDKNYFSVCVETALRTGADNTGGVLLTKGLNQSHIGKAITYVLSSSFGVGNSTFRTGTDVEMEVDTVFGGCYRKDVFNRIGFFNEKLVSSSDMDFNVRLSKAGGKIILNPKAIATYYTRTDFGKFVRNNFRNGFWAIYPLKFLNYLPVRFRHLIPLIFFCCLIGGLSIIWISPILLWIYAAILAIYFLAGTIFSLKYLSKNPLYLFIMPFLFFILHTVYGLGSFVALFRLIFTKSERKSNEAAV